MLAKDELDAAFDMPVVATLTSDVVAAVMSRTKMSGLPVLSFATSALE
jgi:hypothetical protein